MSLGKSFSYLVATYNLCAEILRRYGSVDRAKDAGAFDILVKKYLTSENSMFKLKYKEVGDDGVTDVDILNYANKVKLLPEPYQKIIFDSKYIKDCKKIKKLCSI